MIYKPNSQGVYTTKSVDGKPHTLDVQTNANGRVITTCIECKWTHYGYYRTTKSPLTQARLRDWYAHVGHYELMLGLIPPPLPVWMGSWKSPRRKGELFIYRFDANLPKPLYGYGNNPMAGVTEVSSLIGRREWKSPWAAYNPWLVLEASGGSKQEIYSENRVLSWTANIPEAQRVVHKHLSKRFAKDEIVVFPATEIPEGLEVPLPPIDKFVEGMARIAQTNDYGQIHRALEQVQRGIIQLELLKEIEASLEAKLSIGP
jgi:hypothetical protein